MTAKWRILNQVLLIFGHEVGAVAIKRGEDEG